jgi:hypothetical protein
VDRGSVKSRGIPLRSIQERLKLLHPKPTGKLFIMCDKATLIAVTPSRMSNSLQGRRTTAWLPWTVPRAIAIFVVFASCVRRCSLFSSSVLQVRRKRYDSGVACRASTTILIGRSSILLHEIALAFGL